MTPEKNTKLENKINKINSKVGKNVFRIGLATTMLFGGSSCTPEMIDAIVGTAQAGEVSPLPTDPVRTPTQGEELNFEITPIVENPATEEVTLAPEPTPVYEVQASGGEYNSSQEAINESESAIAQKDRIQGWLDYWINFENRPFAWESTDLHWKYIYDNPDEPKEVMVVLEALGEYEGRMFTSPLGADGFALYPPEITAETDNYIEAGYGPLELSSGDEALWLSVQKGIPIRKDGAGVAVEKLDMKSGQWVVVEATSEIRFTEFSRKFSHLYKESYVAEIEGMQIPIGLGLSHEVVARSNNPIKTAHIVEDIVPILAEIYLKSCHYRFTNMMEGNEGVTYEEYVELVREGKGNLEMYVYNENKNDRFPELMSIDPKQGFAISLVDELLPIEMPSDVSLYVGSDGSGKLFMAQRTSGSFVKTFFDDFLSSYGKEAVWSTIFVQIYQNAFAPIVVFDNDCLKYTSTEGKCDATLVSFPKNWPEMRQKMRDELIKQSEGERGPIFEMTQE